MRILDPWAGIIFGNGGSHGSPRDRSPREDDVTKKRGTTDDITKTGESSRADDITKQGTKAAPPFPKKKPPGHISFATYSTMEPQQAM